MTSVREPRPRAAALRFGRRLQWATIAWNCLEVVVTISLGLAAGSLALVAFGLDSLVEVFASSVVIWHMAPSGDAGASRDVRAMRLVAVAFGVLGAYLAVSSVRALALHDTPDASPAGIAYLAVTAAVMFGLAFVKRRIGRALDSEPFAAEASMTFLDGCLALSILTALVMNAAWQWWWADPVAALLIAGISWHQAVTHWRQ